MRLSVDLEPLVDAIAVRVAAMAGAPDTANPEGAVAPVLLRSGEAARMLGIAEQTLRNWRSRGEGPQAVSRGALIRYRPEDVREWAAREFR